MLRTRTHLSLVMCSKWYAQIIYGMVVGGDYCAVGLVEEAGLRSQILAFMPSRDMSATYGRLSEVPTNPTYKPN
jgi:hypothetical protein